VDGVSGVGSGGVEWKEREDWMKEKEEMEKNKNESTSKQLVAFLLRPVT
jgi:hypothetical protein